MLHEDVLHCNIGELTAESAFVEVPCSASLFAASDLHSHKVSFVLL